MKVRRKFWLSLLAGAAAVVAAVRSRPRNNKNQILSSSWAMISAGCSRASITAVDGW